MLGLNLAFDRGILTDYFASRSYTLRTFSLIANPIKTAFANLKGLLTPNYAFAPIAA